MQARRDGLYLMLLGCIVFLALGIALENFSPVSMVDFGVVYFPARCLLHHGDPYQQSQVQQEFLAERGDRLWNDQKDREIVTRYQYLPSAFAFTLPFAMLPWGPAHILWLSLTAAGLIFAGFLLWSVGAETAPVLCGALIGFLLANCEVLLVLGNPAGIVIGLSAIAVWCFVRERFTAAGVICLAVALALKPHDAGLIWLYFLLAGGAYRKRALQTLGVIAAASVPALVWMWRVAPAWLYELHSNIAGLAVHGGVTDPGPASAGSHGLGMMVNLQATISVFCGDPRIYNPISYVCSGLLILAWALVVLGSRQTPERAWLAIAAASAFTMLPVYHHLYDAKLLMLAVPACAILWARSGVQARLAVGVTALGFVLVGDLTWTALLAPIANLHRPQDGILHQALVGIQVFPAPMAILLVGVFYLFSSIREVRVAARDVPVDPRLDSSRKNSLDGAL